MTRDDIIRMMREAGWSGIYTQWAEPTGKPDWSPFKESLTVPVTMEQIERFAALVAKHEREACAKVCDEIEKKKWLTVTHGGEMHGISARDCAAAIRDRGENNDIA